MATYLVTCSFFLRPDGADSVRFNVAVDFCKQCAMHKVRCVVVDGSQDAHEHIKSRFEEQGQGFVKVVKQEGKGGKGVALREAVRFAHAEVDEKTDAIVFTEIEKVDLPRLVKTIGSPLLDGSLDIVFPTREDRLFKETYAEEQYHSEHFGNRFIHLLCKDFIDAELDFYFGPFAFRAELAQHWLSYSGTSWDAQQVPAILAAMNGNATIGAVSVAYRHDPRQKQQEENDFVFCKKRLFQLSSLLGIIEERVRANLKPS